MLFQVGIASLGGTVFFQVGLCSPLRTMKGGWLRLYSRCIGVLEVILLLMGPSVIISWFS